MSRTSPATPNENYARELMELFTLGPVNDAGVPNYSEQDVQQLAKALTGWQINDADPNAVSSFFTTARWYSGPKVAFGIYGNWKTPDVVNLVLGQPNHPTFLVRKLWGEFISTPITQATLTDLATTYTSSGLQIKPLLAKILTHPDLFASIDEPNMLKTPVVFAVGVLRALGRPITDSTRRRLPRLDGPDAVLPAERLGLGGRALVAQHEHGARALGLRRPRS